jgi:DNA-3-methyladenine glycosylase II
MFLKTCKVPSPQCLSVFQLNVQGRNNKALIIMTMNTIENEKDIQTGLAALAGCCPVLKSVIAQAPDVPLRRTTPGFASLASIIISQQVSKQSAEAIFGRMQEFVVPLTAERYLELGEEVWIKIGLSRPKQRTFLALCQSIADGEIALDELSAMTAADAMDRLVAIKGIGPWTAEVYLLFAVGHRDIFPAGDLALQQAAADAYGLEQRPTDKELRVMAESWAPWRGVAARLLWAFYAVKKGRTAMP